MATTATRLDQLIGESFELEDAAERVQGERDLLVDQSYLRQLERDYRAWFPRAPASRG